MYSLLEDAATFGFEDVISWQPGGKSFKVHQLETFTDTIMTSYFTQSKFKSFQRQLNIYGWKKVQVGPNKGGYHHKFFQQDSPELCSKVTRRASSKDFNNSSSPSDKQEFSFEALMRSSNKENNLFDSEPTLAVSVTPETEKSSIKLEESEIASLFDFFYPKDPVEKRYIDTVFMDDTFTETKNDFDLTPFQFESACLEDFVSVMENDESASQQCLDENDCGLTTDPSDTCFPYKVHLMLENAERENYSHIVSWVKNGTAFKVHDSNAFVEQVLPMFFDQSKYESFRRQLNMYQFTRVPRGKDRGTVSHPSFLQGARWLCEDIKRARFANLHNDHSQ